MMDTTTFIESGPRYNVQSHSPGTKTLVRGISLLNVVSKRNCNINSLALNLGIELKTARRVARTLVNLGYLKCSQDSEYSLGPTLMRLAHLASRQAVLPGVAREHLRRLAAATGDTVYLGVRQGHCVLYLDKIPGTHPIEVSASVGDRISLRSSGVGKALLLDADDETLCRFDADERRRGRRSTSDISAWLQQMHDYRAAACVVEFRDEGELISCVAAPIRDMNGAIAGAISVSTAGHYMDPTRANCVALDVKATAHAISQDLLMNRWSAKTHTN